MTDFVLTPAAVAAAAGAAMLLDAPLADIRVELETNRFGTIGDHCSLREPPLGFDRRQRAQFGKPHGEGLHRRNPCPEPADAASTVKERELVDGQVDHPLDRGLFAWWLIGRCAARHPPFDRPSDPAAVPSHEMR